MYRCSWRAQSHRCYLNAAEAQRLERTPRRSSRCWRAEQQPLTERISRSQQLSNLLSPHSAFPPPVCSPAYFPSSPASHFPLPAQLYGLGASNNVQRAILAANENQTPFQLQVSRVECDSGRRWGWATLQMSSATAASRSSLRVVPLWPSPLPMQMAAAHAAS